MMHDQRYIEMADMEDIAFDERLSYIHARSREATIRRRSRSRRSVRLTTLHSFSITPCDASGGRVLERDPTAGHVVLVLAPHGRPRAGARLLRGQPVQP